MTKLTEKVLSFAPHEIITSHDLTSLLPNRSPDSRYGLVKRALAAGELLRLRRGLYCLAPQFQRQALSPYLLAQHLCGPSYVSLETALSYHHWIPEAVHAIASVTSCKSTQFQTPLGRFTYTRIPQKILYDYVDRLETAATGIVFVAQPLKALADYVYVHKRDWTGLGPVVTSLRIDDAEFEQVTEAELAGLAENYPSRRVKRFLAGLKKDLGR